MPQNPTVYPYVHQRVSVALKLALVEKARRESGRRGRHVGQMEVPMELALAHDKEFAGLVQQYSSEQQTKQTP